jgi:hypothetical protein
MRDARLPPLVLLALLAAVDVYWIVFVVRCGEDECIDRAVVATISVAFAAGAVALVLRLRGRSHPATVLRWSLAVLWPVASCVLLLLLPFDVVFD